MAAIAARAEARTSRARLRTEIIREISLNKVLERARERERERERLFAKSALAAAGVFLADDNHGYLCRYAASPVIAYKRSEAEQCNSTISMISMGRYENFDNVRALLI